MGSHAVIEASPRGRWLDRCNLTLGMRKDDVGDGEPRSRDSLRPRVVEIVVADDAILVW